MTDPHPLRYTPILPLDETALGAAADRLEAWLAFAKTNRPGHDHLRDVGYERHPVGDADLEILLLDFRHHRPTQWAYDRACEAREKHRQRGDAAEAARDQLAAENAIYARAPHPDDAYMHGRADARKEADEEYQPLLAELREQLAALRTEWAVACGPIVPVGANGIPASSLPDRETAERAACDMMRTGLRGLEVASRLVGPWRDAEAEPSAT